MSAAQPSGAPRRSLADTCTPCVLDRKQVAAHCGFVLATFDAWVREGLLPNADPVTGGWTREALDRALECLRTGGFEPALAENKKRDGYYKLPNVHRVPKDTESGKRNHYYRRDMKGALPGAPSSAEFMAALIEKEHQFARQHGAEQIQSPESPPISPEAETPQNAVIETPPRRARAPRLQAGQRRPLTPQPDASDLRTEASPQAPSPSITPEPSPPGPSAPRRIRPKLSAWASLPLYPDEDQIALAVLGPQRATEWKVKAVLLEREGLPPIDALMGGRPWSAVQQFFARRNGLDGLDSAQGSVPNSRRVRCVPFVLDGREIIDAEKEATPGDRGHPRRVRRTRV